MQDQATKQTTGKFLPKRKPFRKRPLIIGAAVVIAAGVLLLPKVFSSKQDVPQLDLMDTTILQYTDLQDTISATGIVESADSNSVYSTVSYPVMAVHVKVGDKVQAGDLLAELDDHSIRNQITSQEINLDLSSQSSNQQVQSAQDTYNNFKSGLDQGLNASVNSAQNQVEAAYDTYIKAKNTYDRYVYSLDAGENTALLSAESAYRNACTAVENAQSAYDQLASAYLEANSAFQQAEAQYQEADAALQQTKADQQTVGEEINLCAAELAELTSIEESLRTEEQNAAIAALELQLSELDAQKQKLDLSRLEQEVTVYMLQTAYDEASSAMPQLETQLENAEKALRQSEEALDLQKASYRAAMTNADNTLADYLTNVDTAWDNYQDALTALASTEKSAQDQLKTYANSLTSAQIGANKASAEESLRQLQENLDDTKVTAPCSGTVTAVFAKVGSTGSGLLFVIEDVDNLVVDTSVKGYDVGTVREGMPVVIRSDATGEKTMDGVLTAIAPTSKKNSLGQSDLTAGDPIFEAEVQVTSKDTGLRIGMEAQLDYIVAEESHVLAVPYEAVYKNDAGLDCILIAVEQEDGRYRIEELPVTSGIDDDLDIAVSGSGVTEGLRVIHAPDSYLHLLGQTVTAGTGLRSDLMSAIMGGAME